MPVGFEATEISVTIEEGVLFTALGTQSSEGNYLYLMFQHQDTFSEQDIELGMNKPDQENQSSSRWWEFYAVRYGMGSGRVQERSGQANHGSVLSGMPASAMQIRW